MREIPREALIRKLHDLNPQWESGDVDLEIRHFRRRGYFDLFYPLVKQSTVHRALVLMGPRRVGKTVLLQQTIQALIDDGVSAKNIIYLSLDTPILQGLSLEELVALYCDIFAMKNSDDTYFIFDEIQYHPEWDRHLKVLVDQNKKTKFIASGSAAAALSRQSKESGAGRFTDFLLPPLTFYEYLNLLGLTERLISRDVDQNRLQCATDIEKLNEEFLNYLNFGGYPEAIFNKEIQKQPDRFIRSDIIEKVLLRDLPSLYGIHDIQELTRLFNVLAYQTGNEVTFEGLSKSSGVSKNTIKKYIEYLEAAFLLKIVDRVDHCGKTFKRANFFKVYLTNPSIYAAIFGVVKADGDEMGSLVETAIFSQYMHDPTIFESVHYARWKNGEGEVDIVMLGQALDVSGCMEVKWSDRFFDHPNDLDGLFFFCGHSALSEATVTTRKLRGYKEIKGLRLRFVESAMACYFIGEGVLSQKGRVLLGGNEEKGAASSSRSNS